MSIYILHIQALSSCCCCCCFKCQNQNFSCCRCCCCCYYFSKLQSIVVVTRCCCCCCCCKCHTIEMQIKSFFFAAKENAHTKNFSRLCFWAVLFIIFYFSLKVKNFFVRRIKTLSFKIQI